MAYVSTVGGDVPELSVAEPAVAASNDDFTLIDRLVVLCGGLAFGAAAGLLTLIALGRPSAIDRLVMGSMLLMVALHLCAQTIQASWARNATLSANTAIMHAIALLIWPILFLLAPAQSSLLWVAPVLAVLTLAVLAFSGSGRCRTVYRLAAEAVIVAALAAYQGGLTLMAG